MYDGTFSSFPQSYKFTTSKEAIWLDQEHFLQYIKDSGFSSPVWYLKDSHLLLSQFNSHLQKAPQLFLTLNTEN